MNQKSGIYFASPSDRKFMDEYLAEFRAMSLEELVAEFNRQARVGITGVRMQLIHLHALNQVLHERTGQDALRAEGPLIRPLRYLTIVDRRLMQQENS